jgi:glutathione peroxidase
MIRESALFRTVVRSFATSLGLVGVVGGLALTACDDGTSADDTQGANVSAAGASGQSAGGSGGGAGTSMGAGNRGGAGTNEPPAGSAGTGGTSEPGPGGGGGSGPSSGEAGAGGSEPAVSPMCAKGGFYDFSAKDLGGTDDVSMCDFAGKVVLVVNVASKCGYTPQYKPLQALYQAYVDKGFVVLGFPSADFGNQEFADDSDISAFCTSTYGITFPMFSRIDVKGPNQLPLYGWLTTQPGGEGEITWNFNKFLLDRHGVFVQRFDTAVSPDSAVITGAVEAELAKP